MKFSIQTINHMHDIVVTKLMIHNYHNNFQGILKSFEVLANSLQYSIICGLAFQPCLVSIMNMKSHGRKFVTVLQPTKFFNLENGSIVRINLP